MKLSPRSRLLPRPTPAEVTGFGSMLPAGQSAAMAPRITGAGLLPVRTEKFPSSPDRQQGTLATSLLYVAVKLPVVTFSY